MARRLHPAKYRNIGLLILRAGIGIMCILHGYPKLFGGPEMWEQVGSATQAIGIDTLPSAFGFIAGAIIFFGGICLLLGLFFRPALAFLILAMIMAAAIQMGEGHSFLAVSHPVEIAIVFVSLLFTGPGKYNLKNRLAKQRRRW